MTSHRTPRAVSLRQWDPRSAWTSARRRWHALVHTNGDSRGWHSSSTVCLTTGCFHETTFYRFETSSKKPRQKRRESRLTPTRSAQLPCRIESPRRADCGRCGLRALFPPTASPGRPRLFPEHGYDSAYIKIGVFKSVCWNWLHLCEYTCTYAIIIWVYMYLLHIYACISRIF